MPTKPRTVETGKQGDRTLMGVAGGTCVVASLITTPVMGMAMGLAVAAFLLAMRGRVPTVGEVVKVILALAVTATIVVVLAGWGDFKEGIGEGFHRVSDP